MSDFSESIKATPVPNYDSARSLSDLNMLFPESYFKKHFSKDEDDNYSVTYTNNLMNSLISVYKATVSDENIDLLSNIVSAILLELNRLYPDLKAEILFRVKSERSFIYNIRKVFLKEKIENPHEFFEDLLKDILALKLIIYPPENTATLLRKENYNEFNIGQLIYESIKNSEAATEALLFANQPDIIRTRNKYFSYYKKVLDRLKNSVYDEETATINEINRYPNPQHEQDIERNITKKHLNNLRDLSELLAERSADRLLNKIAEQILIKICKEPLISNSLEVSCDIESAKADTAGWSRKSSGFVAFFTTIHSTLLSSDGTSIEGQVLNDKRYEIDRNSHNNLKYDPLKKVEIFDLFTLKTPSNNIDEDKHNLELILNKLDEFSLKDKNSEEVKKLINLIKIDNTKLLINSKLNPIQDTNDISSHHQLNPDTFLQPSLVYLTPKMFSAKIEPRGDDTPTVVVKESSVIDCFSDVLRKDDEISILDYLLLEFLREIYPELSEETYKKYTYDSIENYVEKVKNNRENQNEKSHID